MISTGPSGGAGGEELLPSGEKPAVVENNPRESFGLSVQTHREKRVIRNHGGRAHEDRVREETLPMHQKPGLGTRDVSAARDGHPAVEGLRPLEMNVGPAPPVEGVVGRVHGQPLPFEEAHLNHDAQAS